MYKLSKTITIVCAILLALNIIFGIRSSYKYEKEIGYHWSLADKSSTIEKKSKHVNDFIESLEKSNLHGDYDAIFFKTPNNSFDENLETLKSLNTRLKEILNLDVQSYEYQVAMQQITSQEFYNYEITSVIKGIWIKNNYFLLWNWVCFIQVTIVLISLVVFGIIYINNRK